jgi:N-methylhydantoinase A
MSSFQIGCDIGGTFTDVVVLDERGRTYTDKSDTTPRDLGEGVIAAIGNVAGQIGISPEQLLSQTTRFVNGTTAVTNSIAELRGAKVGLVVTRGFRDTLRIARSARNAERDHHRQLSVPDVVGRDCIVEVNERVDRKGEVVVGLTEDEARRAIDELVAKGVESLAVCLLWSFQNPAHEQLLRDVAAREHPELYMSVSSTLYPMMREYERMMTTVLNSFTGLRVAEYTAGVEARLGKMGLGVPVSFMQSFGGTLTAEEARARPIALVDSGPVGGVVGANDLGRRIGIENIITADMGGTSLDVSVITENRYTVTQRVKLREFLTGLSKVDVATVGAGGGSIAWLDTRGMPQVGPRSAGADPGPACYGRGGDQPTVTDASVALGIMDPGAFLGGRRTLDREKSREAIKRVIGDPLGMTDEEAASAIYRLVVANMSSAVRSVTVERGRDPRDFTLFAFGGALPVFAADICQDMGIRRLVVAAESAVFSAAGLLGTDDVRNLMRSAFWSEGTAVAEVNEALESLEREARASLVEAGHLEQDITVERQGDFKFEGQLFELTVPIADGHVDEQHLESILERFPGLYEAEYGEGTAWVESPIHLLAVRVVATGRTEKIEPQPPERKTGEALRTERDVYLPSEGRRIRVPVYEADLLDEEATVDGPAIIEHRLTTTVVPRGWQLSLDHLGNFHLEDRRELSGLAAASAPAQATV